MLCLADFKTSRGPTKSRASMPGCSVNNTLMIGTESVVAMVATEWLPCGDDSSWWAFWAGWIDAVDVNRSKREVCVEDSRSHAVTLT